MLSARGLALRRGHAWLFRGLDLTLEPGQLCWLRGQNGSGKTSLLRTLVGLSRPETGAVDHLADRPVYIGHGTALKEDLSAHEALQFLASLHGRDHDADGIDAALRRLQVQQGSRRSVRTLSQGQRRRVALARLALEDRPALWVLDEPFDALDPAGMDIVLQLIREHLLRQGAVILTSHMPFSLPGMPLFVLDLDTRASHA